MRLEQQQRYLEDIAAEEERAISSALECCLRPRALYRRARRPRAGPSSATFRLRRENTRSALMRR